MSVNCSLCLARLVFSLDFGLSGFRLVVECVVLFFFLYGCVVSCVCLVGCCFCLILFFRLLRLLSFFWVAVGWCSFGHCNLVLLIF